VFDFPPVNKDRGFACIDAMRSIAKAHDCSVARIALAWLLHRSPVTSVIIGAKTVEQLADNLAAKDVKLSADELKALDEVSKLPAEYPGWMLERQGADRAKYL
jgi:aryl-alcohol dehydrogenase-like predicted oxidoreductase